MPQNYLNLGQYQIKFICYILINNYKLLIISNKGITSAVLLHLADPGHLIHGYIENVANRQYP